MSSKMPASNAVLFLTPGMIPGNPMPFILTRARRAGQSLWLEALNIISVAITFIEHK